MNLITDDVFKQKKLKINLKIHYFITFEKKLLKKLWKTDIIRKNNFEGE